MARILANDGIAADAKVIMEKAGHVVVTEKVPMDQLAQALGGYDAIIVRSATQVRRDLIDACPNLQFIGRAGVGMDNIDVDYARSKGITVANTPGASSASVAELAVAHMFALVRFLHRSNSEMPGQGAAGFNALKKAYSEGKELKGKTLGVIGAGRIGMETMKLGVGLGMRVIATDTSPRDIRFSLDLHADNILGSVEARVPFVPKEELLAQSDFVSLHVPFTGSPVIGSQEIDLMKSGAVLINCARGGTVDETALIQALDSGKLAFAGIDVFEEEPSHNKALLAHPNTSVSPHIGGSTREAQDRIGTELAHTVVRFFSK
ncbi:MAG: D-2-hydroxyacid dehydrogenase [Bacteroidetes bacterium]|jgi:D-3-phosphoglycerate dehydrogenase|nr:D-2-hydroxyacid dehydrogenase [Bacteroidota bacterium]